MTCQQPQPVTKDEITSNVRIGKRIILSITLLIVFGIFRYILPERPLNYTGLRAWADHIFAIGFLGGVLLVGGGIGVKMIKWLQVVPSSYLETIVFGVPIGLGVFSYGILALGLLGLVQAHFFLLWFIFAFFWSFQECWELASTGVAKLREALRTFHRLDIEKIPLAFAIVLIFCITLIQALTPAWDYDALMYHLQGPRIFLDTGKILPLPDVWQANGPFTIEMLFMFGLRFGSDTFAKLLHMSYATLLVLATLVFGRRFLGREGGWIAAVVLVAIPIFPIWSALANADMAWAVYEFLGVYAMILWLKTRHHEWLALSGLVIGLSLGSKYLALGNTCVLALFVIYNSRREGLKRMIRNAAVFGGIALFIGSPWYLKNWLWTGNPVFPLYFGGPAWPAERVRLLMSFLNSFGTGHGVLDYLLLPWNIYAQNQYFSTAGFPIEIPSLLFPLLLFYPLLHHKKTIHILAVIVLIRLVVWATGSQQIRFLLPAFPGLSLLVSSILVGVDHTFIQKRGGFILRTGLLGGVTVITLFISSTFFGIRPQGVIIGSESKVSFLSRMLVDFPAITYIQKHLAPEDRALLMWHGEGLYCDRRCLPDTERGRWTFLAMAANYDVPTMATRLREAGITHLLYIKGSSHFNLQNDPAGENYKAASFFLKQFRDNCTELVYSDQESNLYKITCQT